MEIDSIFSECEKTGAWYGTKITSVRQTNFMGDTPLHTVCSWGDVDAAKILLEAGADVNAKGDQGATPLFNAIIGENPDVIKLLLMKGAKTDIKNDYDRLPLEYAINVSSPKEIISLLTSRRTKKGGRV